LRQSAGHPSVILRSLAFLGRIPGEKPLQQVFF
jgi:hypothetical protein